MKNLRPIISGAWGILALWYIFVLLPNESTAANGLAFVGFFVSALIGVITQTKHPWSTWVVTGATTFMGLWSLILILVERSEGLPALLLCIVTIIFTWIKTSRAELHATVGWRQNTKALGVAVLGVSFLAMLLGFGISEAKNVQSSVQKMRLESACTDPKVDIEACGQLGIAQVNSAQTEKEVIAGRDLLDTMCKNGNPVACRRLLYARMSWQIDDLKYRDLPGELWKRCQDDGGTACLALTLGEHELPSGLIEVAQAKCSESDLDACVAWAAAARSDHDAAHIKSCELGIEGACTCSGVPAEVRKKACAQSQNPWTCYAANGGSNYCELGVWPACDPVTWPEKRWEQIRWSERLRIKPAELTPPWENLEAGREIIRKTHAVWRPDPMPLAEIERTFGAACDAGIAYGCTEGANAAANVQLEFRTQERIDHAQKSLNKGCKTGDYLACWQLFSIARLSPEMTMKHARDACYAAPRGVRTYPELCRTYAHLWMAEVGITPWLMDSTLATPESIAKCAEQKDRFLCLAVAESTRFELDTPEPTGMPQHIVGRDGAAISCSKNVTYGCEEMIKLARAWPVEPEQSPQDLAKTICAGLPKMCETVQQALPSVANR
jgi:hypothetical protein